MAGRVRSAAAQIAGLDLSAAPASIKKPKKSTRRKNVSKKRLNLYTTAVAHSATDTQVGLENDW